MGNVITRPISFPFQLYTSMFAEGGGTMNNSLKFIFFLSSKFNLCRNIIILISPPVAQFAEQLVLKFCFKLYSLKMK